MSGFITEAIITALIGFAGVMGGAAVTFVTARQNAQQHKQEKLQQRIDELEYRNRKLWRYTVELINAVNNHATKVPPPPLEIKDLYEVENDKK